MASSCVHAFPVFSRPLSANQIKLVEMYISRSPDATPFAKRTFIWLLRKSQGTRAVCVSFPAKLNRYGDQALDGFHSIVSVGGTTRIDVFLGLLNTSVLPSHHSGGYPDGSNEFTVPDGFTFWLSDTPYDNSAEHLSLNIEEINSISLHPEST